MAKCDLCSSGCASGKLAQLQDGYQAAGVVDICPSCTKFVNKLRQDMLLEIAPRMRAAIADRKGAHKTLWQRLKNFCNNKKGNKNGKP